MGILIIRVIFAAICAAAGYLGAWQLYHDQASALMGLAVGIGAAVVVMLVEQSIRKAPFGEVAGGVVGLMFGLLGAWLAALPLSLVPASPLSAVITVLLSAVFGYAGLTIGITRSASFDFSRLKGVFTDTEHGADIKILDTSAIIDGRIADVCETGFVGGTLIIPQFVLKELQYIADSSDSMKRAKGRRGLDILHRIQKMTGLTVEIVDEDFPKIREVDDKLVALARKMGAKIVTNDFNLNKVAVLQGVTVLNINELSNAVKPLVLLGEVMRVFVMKEGKEPGQGVAYLDDGTMIVVENGRRLIGKTIEVTVTSVLQTTAGRMIFTRPKEESDREDSLVGGRV